MHLGLLLSVITICATCHAFRLTDTGSNFMDLLEIVPLEASMKGNRHFFNFIESIESDKTYNFANSPYTSLFETNFGDSFDNTTNAMLKSIKMLSEEDLKRYMFGFENTFDDLSGGENKEINIESKHFIHNSVKLDKALENLMQSLQTTVEQLDFQNQEHVVASINFWISKKTDNKTNDIVKPEDLNSSIKSVAVNIMSYENEWKDKFDNKPLQQTFYTDDQHMTFSNPIIPPQETVGLDPLHPKSKVKLVHIPHKDNEWIMVQIIYS